MKLQGSTYGKLFLIAALCVILCVSFAVGTTADDGQYPGSAEDAERRPITAPLEASTVGDGDTVRSASDDGAAAEGSADPAFAKASSKRLMVSADPVSTDGLGALLSTESFDPAGVDSLSINWAAGTVDVCVVADRVTNGQIRVSEYVRGGAARQPLMRVANDGRSLSIDYAESVGALVGCSFGGSKHLVVEVPEKMADGLRRFDLDAASGSHYVSGLACEMMDLTVASGVVTVEGVDASTLRVDMASGRSTITGIFTERTEVNVASGTVALTCERACPATAAMDIASGRVDLTLPANSGFRANVDKLSGNFDCGFPTTQSGSSYACGDGSASISASIMSGTLSIQPGAEG